MLLIHLITVFSYLCSSTDHLFSHSIEWSHSSLQSSIPMVFWCLVDLLRGLSRSFLFSLVVYQHPHQEQDERGIGSSSCSSLQHCFRQSDWHFHMQVPFKSVGIVWFHPKFLPWLHITTLKVRRSHCIQKTGLAWEVPYLLPEPSEGVWKGLVFSYLPTSCVGSWEWTPSSDHLVQEDGIHSEPTIHKVNSGSQSSTFLWIYKGHQHFPSSEEGYGSWRVCSLI